MWQVPRAWLTDAWAVPIVTRQGARAGQDESLASAAREYMPRMAGVWVAGHGVRVCMCACVRVHLRVHVSMVVFLGVHSGVGMRFCVIAYRE